MNSEGWALSVESVLQGGYGGRGKLLLLLLLSRTSTVVVCSIVSKIDIEKEVKDRGPLFSTKYPKLLLYVEDTYMCPPPPSRPRGSDDVPRIRNCCDL